MKGLMSGLGNFIHVWIGPMIRFGLFVAITVWGLRQISGIDVSPEQVAAISAFAMAINFVISK